MSDRTPNTVRPLPYRVGRSAAISARRHRAAGVLLAFALIGGAGLLATSCQSSRSTGTPAPSAPALVDESAWRVPPRLEGEPDIRVRLERDATSVSITAPVAVLLDGSAYSTPLTIERGSVGWRVRSSDGRVRLVGGDARTRTLTIADIDGSSSYEDPIVLDGTPLAGRVVLHARPRVSEGVFDVVEHVPMETYVAGVISKELFGGWSLTAFRAQAIAARSYALHEQARRQRLGIHFDVASTTADQVYAGLSNNPTALRAVHDTAGLALTWDGGVLRTYYSSTCGGRSASACETWRCDGEFAYNRAGPIQTSPRVDCCAASPLFRWEVTRPRDALSRRIRAWGRAREHDVRNIKRVASVEVIERNAHDRPSRYRVTDDAGRSFELSPESLRVACNTGVRGLKNITRDTRVNSGDLDIEVRGRDVMLRGRGFGHGVGMCQYGAQGMSEMGIDAYDILAHYYPGAEIERVY
ncbi:MAG: SpoIID/LytB domain-containing protein [Planctomycetota bacterium]